MSRLHEIEGCKMAEPKADVLFIHGLGGDAFDTWRQGKEDSALWPGWVAQAFPTVKVWTLGYAASPTKTTRFLRWFSRNWRDKGQSMPLPDRALQVLDLMVQRGFGKRPIIFVCHSLGGLLVKQVLRISDEANDAKKHGVFEHARAVLFLATPHAGADLATLADKFRIVFNGTVTMEDLRAHDAHLRDLFNWYRRHSADANIQTVSYFETRSLLGVIIVDPTSAHPGVGDDPIGQDEDHISIAKPRGKDGQVCGALNQLIRDNGFGPNTQPSTPSPVPPPPSTPSSGSPPPSQFNVTININVTFDADLRDLVSRGLLHHDPKEGRFDLHPIVRHYAYDRLTATDRTTAHARLRDYFQAVPKVEKVTRLEDLASVIELYHHTVRAGQFDEALDLFRARLHKELYYHLGANQLIIDLLSPIFSDGEDCPPCLKSETMQAWTLNVLANSHSLSGQPRRAVPLYEQHNTISEKLGNKENLAIGLGNVARSAQLPIGALRTAKANLHSRITLCREIKEEFREAVGHQELGRLLAYCGDYVKSAKELQWSTDNWNAKNDTQGLCLDEAYRAQRELFLLRSIPPHSILHPPSLLSAARRTLELADEFARTNYPFEQDFVQAHWLLGAAYRVVGQLDEAERHLHEALERCRRINLVDTEADILIDLTRLRAATGMPDEAERLAKEALLITERSEYVLQGADARLELAKLALGYYSSATPVPPGQTGPDWWSGAVFPKLVAAALQRATPEQKKLALEHALKAKKLATCDGPPDYTYKVAYDEACELLKQLSGK